MALAAGMLGSMLRRSFDDLRWLLEDVDEEDCFWEPAEPCWSVRRRADAGMAWGTGAWVCEDAWPAPDPLPLTTIAWRLAHLAAWTDVYRSFAFDEDRLDLLGFDVPGTRDGLVAWLRAAQERLGAQVDALDDAELAELRPAYFGPPRPLHRLISTMVVEHTHHGAEIGLLRDLRRGHARLRPPPADDAST
jgi:DinB superfamily